MYPYGDNPMDAIFIELGFDYYDEHRANLDGDLW